MNDTHCYPIELFTSVYTHITNRIIHIQIPRRLGAKLFRAACMKISEFVRGEGVHSEYIVTFFVCF